MVSLLLVIDPLIGSAVIGAGASILGGIGSLFGSKKSNNNNLQATRETNETNLKIARETNRANSYLNYRNNQFNAQQAAQANQWSIEQWNRENEYNSPSAQRARLEAAGYNPNVLASSFSPTAASSLQSAQADASSAIPMQAAQMQAPRFENEWQGFSNSLLGIPAAVAQAASAKKMSVETQGQALKNAQEAINLKYKDPMANVTFQTALQQYNQAVADAKVAQGTVDYKIRSEAAKADLDEANAKLAQLNVDAFPERFRNEMRAIEQDIELKFEQGKLTREQALTEVKKRLLIAAQIKETDSRTEVNKATAAKLSVETEQIEQLTPILVDKASAEADIAANDAEWRNDMNAADYHNKNVRTNSSSVKLGPAGGASMSRNYEAKPDEDYKAVRNRKAAQLRRKRK